MPASAAASSRSGFVDHGLLDQLQLYQSDSRARVQLNNFVLHHDGLDLASLKHLVLHHDDIDIIQELEVKPTGSR